MAALTRRVLIEALDKIAARFPQAAGTVRATLHHIFEIAIDRGVVESNPLAHRRRGGSLKNKNLKQAGPKALSIEDLARIWVAAGDSSVNRAFGVYVRGLIATGARRTELSLAHYENIAPATNETPAQLLLKGPTTKTGVDHIVFLPPLILREIEQLPRRADSPLIFQGRHRAKKTPPMSGWTKLLAPLVAAAKVLGVKEKIHLHGLRRGFRTGLSAIGVDRDLAEKMICHNTGGALVAIYDKHQFQKERGDAALKWCDALASEIAKIKYATAAGAAAGAETVRLSA
jgi:integrase